MTYLLIVMTKVNDRWSTGVKLCHTRAEIRETALPVSAWDRDSMITKSEQVGHSFIATKNPDGPIIHLFSNVSMFNLTPEHNPDDDEAVLDWMTEMLVKALELTREWRNDI